MTIVRIQNRKRKRIHINRHVMARNKKQQENKPAIGIEQVGAAKRYAHTVQIDGPAVVIHNETRPLKCGARCWVETSANLILEVD